MHKISDVLDLVDRSNENFVIKENEIREHDSDELPTKAILCADIPTVMKILKEVFGGKDKSIATNTVLGLGIVLMFQ